jgi:ribosome-associated toxin RatA of RatAB toxin-antitoxin module
VQDPRSRHILARSRSAIAHEHRLATRTHDPVSRMREIPVATVRSTDEITVPQSPADVYAALTDFDDYDAWWPWFVHVHAVEVRDEIIGSDIAVEPLTGFAFRCRVEQCVPNASMRVRYHTGPYAGCGDWTLAAVSGGTHVSYAVDLTSSHPVIGQVGQFVDLGLAHSLLMRGVLAGLRRVLDDRSRRALGVREIPRIVGRNEAAP